MTAAKLIKQLEQDATTARDKAEKSKNTPFYAGYQRKAAELIANAEYARQARHWTQLFEASTGRSWQEATSNPTPSQQQVAKKLDQLTQYVSDNKLYAEFEVIIEKLGEIRSIHHG